MSRPELKPCPFCGSAPDKPSYLSARIAAHCECGAIGPSIWTGGPNPTREEYNKAEAEATAAWNRRALTAAPQPAPAVGIKPLEWPAECPRGRRVNGSGLNGTLIYCIVHHGAPYIYQWAAASSPWSEPFESYEAATAAAQSDYEFRIRAALVAQPVDEAANADR
jgi:Lar family restriction alleviation protein